MYRKDDYLERRKHLANLSDEELYQRFWDLSNKIVDPMLEMAKTHTSPAIEQSVLLRMGFSSLETQEIVRHCHENRLLGRGAGHIVWRLAKHHNTGIREAGLSLIGDKAEQNWTEVKRLFERGV